MIKGTPSQKRQYYARRSKSWYTRTREAIIALLGGKCVRCGFSDRRALQVDHINGKGTKERRTLYKGTTTYFHQMLKYLTENTEQNKYQLLCANCNWIKRVENKENN